MPTTHTVPPLLLDAALEHNSYRTATADIRQNIIHPPLNASDPFFRVLDETLTTEARIRSLANEMLCLIARGDGWLIGGPDAQLVEMLAEHRIIRESLDREYAERMRRPGA